MSEQQNQESRSNGASQPGRMDALKNAAHDPRIKEYGIKAAQAVGITLAVGVAVGVANVIAVKTAALMS